MGARFGANRSLPPPRIPQDPHRAPGLQVTSVLRHVSRQYLQEGMGMRYTRPTRKSVGCVSIVVQFRVIDETEIVIEPPFVRIITNAKFVEFDGSIRHAGAVRGLRREKI